MVVDDDPDVLTVIQKALQKWDLISDGFTDPEKALDHFTRNSQMYSLVISDVKMPEMNGFAFLERVTEINPQVKVMMMTAYFSDMLEIPKVLEGILRIDAILEKPSGIKTICKHVQKQLRR
jgi:DNA-binding NtrC family response regulator